MSLDTLNRYALAMELLSLDARISIVAKETVLSPAILRKAFVEMHQRSPSSGSMRTSPLFMCKSFSKLKESTLCAVFFRLENHQHCARRVINGYRRYRSYINSVSNTDPLLDFSDAWVISTWLEIEVVKLVRCGHCRSAKLINNELQHNVCSVCRT
ncbi:MAG: FlhC family transcriptional regulator [Methylobacter sp.]|nr:FlhC family transcriptional regulator [Methylobacter sp.]